METDRKPTPSAASSKFKKPEMPTVAFDRSKMMGLLESVSGGSENSKQPPSTAASSSDGCVYN